MRLNADFTQRVSIAPEQYQWVDSPVTGVQRMMLDRIGDEVARATSLVRHAPNSEFPSHQHGGGEEILVLEGEFADEHGSYPVGFYLRNPIGTGHSPRVGAHGATLFVKLHQFAQDDSQPKVIDTRRESWSAGSVPGIEVMSLHEYEGEQVVLIKWAPMTRYPQHSHCGGEEILVLEGAFFDESGSYPAGTWVRHPHMSEHAPFTKEEGALIYVKTGHLPQE